MPSPEYERVINSCLFIGLLMFIHSSTHVYSFVYSCLFIGLLMFIHWSTHVYSLVSPVSSCASGHLQPNRSSKGSASTYQHVYFKLDIPNASAVSVVIGKEWVKLVKSEPCTWEGEVRIFICRPIYIYSYLWRVCRLNRQE